MARSTLGANMRSNRPPIPPAPSQAVEICTIDAPPCGETVNVVTALESVSDSVRIRPGSGSATFIRYSQVRPPAVILNRVIVPAPTPPDPPGSRKTPEAGNADDARACPRHTGRPHRQAHPPYAQRRPASLPCRSVYHGAEHTHMVDMPVIVRHQDRGALRLDHRHDQALCRRRAVI
jgi:hypothetical protein